MNLKEIKDLIELVSDKGFAEFEIERQGFRLRISRFRESSPLAAAPVIISSGVPSTELLAPVAHRGLIEAKTPAGSTPAAAKPAAEASARQPEPGLHPIKSPIVGTFYRAASPNTPPFVNVGDKVTRDTVVCIIEAMKLMNEIQAEVDGVISEIYVENGQPVEYGQPLFGVKD